MLEGTEDGIWKPTAGKQDDAVLWTSVRLTRYVVEFVLNGNALLTVKIKESAQVRERMKEAILAGLCYRPKDRVPRAMLFYGPWTCLSLKGHGRSCADGGGRYRRAHTACAG